MAQRADIQNDLLRPNHLPAVAGGFGPSDPEIRGALVSKRFFSPQGGGGEPPLDPPLDPPLEKQISCMQL